MLHPDLATSVGPAPRAAGATGGAQASRLAHVDALRGLAALAVCWFHLTNQYAQGSWTRWRGSYGWLGVEVFFVISGFVLPHALHNRGYVAGNHWRLFLWKRTLRIEPPYLAAVALCLLLWHLSTLAPGFRGVAPPPLAAPQVLLHVGYLNGLAGYEWLNPVFWSLAIEFQFYLALMFGYVWLARANTSIQAATVILMCVLPLALPSKVLLPRYLPLFLLGIAAWQWRSGLCRTPMLLAAWIGAALSLAVVEGPLFALTGLATAAALLGLPALGRSGALRALGAISFSLYLVHVPVGGRVINLGQRFISGPLGEWALSLTALGVSVVCAWIFFRAIEAPAQRWSGALRYA